MVNIITRNVGPWSPGIVRVGGSSTSLNSYNTDIVANAANEDQVTTRILYGDLPSGVYTIPATGTYRIFGATSIFVTNNFAGLNSYQTIVKLLKTDASITEIAGGDATPGRIEDPIFGVITNGISSFDKTMSLTMGDKVYVDMRRSSGLLPISYKFRDGNFHVIQLS